MFNFRFIVLNVIGTLLIAGHREAYGPVDSALQRKPIIEIPNLETETCNDDGMPRPIDTQAEQRQEIISIDTHLVRTLERFRVKLNNQARISIAFSLVQSEGEELIKEIRKIIDDYNLKSSAISLIATALNELVDSDSGMQSEKLERKVALVLEMLDGYYLTFHDLCGMLVESHSDIESELLKKAIKKISKLLVYKFDSVVDYDNFVSAIKKGDVGIVEFFIKIGNNPFDPKNPFHDHDGIDSIKNLYKKLKKTAANKNSKNEIYEDRSAPTVNNKERVNSEKKPAHSSTPSQTRTNSDKNPSSSASKTRTGSSVPTVQSTRSPAPSRTQTSSDKNPGIHEKSRKSKDAGFSNFGPFFNSNPDAYKNRIEQKKKNLLKIHKYSSNKLVNAIMNDVPVKKIESLINEELAYAIKKNAPKQKIDSLRNQQWELLNYEDKYGNTLVHIACLANRADILRILIDKYYLDISAKNKEGFPPVHFLIEMGGCSECLQALIDLGADMYETVKVRL